MIFCFLDFFLNMRCFRNYRNLQSVINLAPKLRDAYLIPQPVFRHVPSEVDFTAIIKRSQNRKYTGLEAWFINLRIYAKSWHCLVGNVSDFVTSCERNLSLVYIKYVISRLFIKCITVTFTYCLHI